MTPLTALRNAPWFGSQPVHPRAAAWGFLCLVFLLWANWARADIVRNLFQAQVPVENQSAAALDDAAGAALQQVLVKVSGSTRLLRDAQVVKAVGGARSHVEQYSYARPFGAQGGLHARFTFDSIYIQHLVAEADAPLWTANRPVVVTWLVVEDAQGKRFVNSDSAPELLAYLQAAFDQRGLPLQLPLFDLTDAAALSAQQAWDLNTARARNASERYAAEYILLGRLRATGDAHSGVWSGDWRYLFDGGQRSAPVTATPLPKALDAGVGVAAADIAGRYAVSPTLASADGVLMRVSGVESYADYATIVGWLEGLDLVEHANVVAVREDTLDLRLWAQANAAQLATVIELNKRFVPLPMEPLSEGLPGSAGPRPLRYGWRR